jgi:DNA-binding CsgD family transcriptional regulator
MLPSKQEAFLKNQAVPTIKSSLPCADARSSDMAPVAGRTGSEWPSVVATPPPRSTRGQLSLQALPTSCPETQASDATQNLCLALGLATRLVRDIGRPSDAVENALETFLTAIAFTRIRIREPLAKKAEIGGLKRLADFRGDNIDTHQSTCISETTLSTRERDILELISGGLSNKQIAKTLNIGPETVKSHISRIFIKLGADRRAQAVGRAQDLGIIRPVAERKRSTLMFHEDLPDRC